MLQNYTEEILIILEKSIEGSKKDFQWLLDNKYPELAAFSNAVNGDDEAVFWLLKNGFPVLGVLCNALDEEPFATKWMQEYNDKILIHFVKAAHGDELSKAVLIKNNFHRLKSIADTIQNLQYLRDKNNTFWYKR